MKVILNIFRGSFIIMTSKRSVINNAKKSNSCSDILDTHDINYD